MRGRRSRSTICVVEIVEVDPRDQTWEELSPRYRVYFFEGATSSEFEVRCAPDVHAVTAWAEAESAGRGYVLSVWTDHGEGVGLLRLAGADPREM